ncbi:type III-A CRISPR-associated RAMP protein Csm4 [Desulfobulbus oligotrophicus]|uniref:CRISPR system Cms protein Csm4 n=1 Tax=Desulfobulbus oligotrophicus TaxID=1909699 RepID=A0A7T5VF30_9BACT|nr:type III-A CRISPR-associated RAMP protein Csm4 [Desulfobulbus oligotrophicus]QQG66594.1 type III-A CRISPR-associated RAMP protein Csm4 [Desulfobulbus oligotrophicus]
MNQVYHLNFTTPVHFGLEGIGQEQIDHIVHSDTLWGAIIDKWLLLHADDPEEVCTSTSFNVSSTFPLINGTRFYPVPLGALNKVMDDVALLDAGISPLELKDIKKIRYIEENLFKRILAGEEPILADLTSGSVYPFPFSTKKEQNPTRCFALEIQRPRVMVDQLNGGVQAGAFFYSTDQYFNQNSGLFFVASFTSRAVRDKFEAALRLLGDDGLGADRSVGRGTFTFTVSNWPLTTADNADAHVLLSLYFPTAEEVKDGVLSSPISAYKLTRRSGHTGGHRVSRFRRADCWMLTEGSVLPFAPAGHVPCVLPQSGIIPHNVYRYGRAFCVPFVRRRKQ